MFETTLLESSFDRVPVLTRRYRMVSMLAGLAGFLLTWKLLPICFFAVSPKTTLVYSLLLGAGVALDALMACYVYAEARRLEYDAGRWLAITLFSSVAGFMAFLVHTAHRTGEWKRVTVPLASVLEILLLSVLVLVPLVRTQALGWKELQNETIYLPLPPPPRIVAVVRERATRPTPHIIRDGAIIAPDVIPEKIAQIIEESAAPDVPDIGVTGGTGIPSNSRNDILNRMLADAGRTAPPPPAPVEPKTQHPIRIKVSVLEAAKLIYSPRPDYPPLAKMARIEGTVRLEAIIGTDGRVQNLAVISGHPLLVNAALQAVSQWRYQPTLLNGEPVEVQTQIDVKFVLGD